MIRNLKMTIWNEKGEKLNFEAMGVGETTSSKDFASLLMLLAAQVGEATTVCPGFIDWAAEDKLGGSKDV